jgi:hypothetical protein
MPHDGDNTGTLGTLGDACWHAERHSGRNNLTRRDVTRGWFWVEVFDAAHDFVLSRSVWVVVGNAGTFLEAG